ncbi:MAG: Grx4 family monothiol glutaredoxin [Myxococcales bacterium]|nr:Grx4 family monothiol glutaredoxin [Myxococcales bacterium]MCB9626045.1 Grx4 family monothiol glutaredoxin [Sandaracinaceae bacterium]
MSTLTPELKERLDGLVQQAPVVLFMKGSKNFPQCGFSATVVEVLKRAGVTDFATVNILQDQEVRQGMKDYSNWPTFPQLFVRGELVGGCDIVRELYESGELQKILAG